MIFLSISNNILCIVFSYTVEVSEVIQEGEGGYWGCNPEMLLHYAVHLYCLVCSCIDLQISLRFSATSSATSAIIVLHRRAAKRKTGVAQLLYALHMHYCYNPIMIHSKIPRCATEWQGHTHVTF